MLGGGVAVRCGAVRYGGWACIAPFDPPESVRTGPAANADSGRSRLIHANPSACFINLQ
jgi:hypothetical protein